MQYFQEKKDKSKKYPTPKEAVDEARKKEASRPVPSSASIISKAHDEMAKGAPDSFAKSMRPPQEPVSINGKPLMNKTITVGDEKIRVTVTPVESK